MGVPTTVPTLILQPFASAGNIQAVPQTDPSAFVNFTQGYTPDYEINLASGNPAAKAVERPIMNWMFQLLTASSQWWQNVGFAPWYSSMSGGYAYNSICVRQGGDGKWRPYRSLVDANVADPLSSTNWEYVQFPHELLANIPMPQGGSLGSGSSIITAATDFNTIGTGTFQTSSDAVAASCPHAPAVLGQSSLAGLLQSMSWTISGNTFGSQLYMDRTSQIFVRGMSNGSWANWRNLFAAPDVYVVGEIRTWSGTATAAAVTAAWGPGWHLCDGTNGTVDLRDKMVVGQSPTKAVNSTGGSATSSLVTANLPSHSHVMSVNDTGHTHTINQTPHTHGLNDPGHNHYVNDPGHLHGINDPGHSHGVNDPGHSHSLVMSSLPQSGSSNRCYVPSQIYGPTGQYSENTNGSGTGIWLSGSGTGISIRGVGAGIYLSASGTGMSVQTSNANVSNASSTTGIQVTAANTGSGSSFNVQNPYMALCYVQYTGA